jgi:NAD(P)H dehydrogenase (quinone)
MTHAIVGATGNTGIRVVDAFRQRGLTVRAVVRGADGARRAAALGITDTATAELQDVGALQRAFEGARAIHVVPPLFDPQEDVLVGNAVTAAERAGVERFVFHSVLHPHTPTLRHHMRKARAEARIHDSSLDWTILQPAMYAQTVLIYYGRAGSEDAITIPYALSARFTVIDVSDIAEISAIVASEDGHSYATYELAGPEVLTTAELATQLASVLGRSLEVRTIAPQALSLPPEWTLSAIADVMAMWADYDQHGLVGNPRVASMLLGRPPTGFHAAMSRDLGDGAGSGGGVSAQRAVP